MGKNFIHASRIRHAARKRKDRSKYQTLRKLIDDNAYKIEPSKPLKNGKLFKYWKNRRRLFSKIDSSSIYMTDELWFSVTPERIACFLANFVKACIPNGERILDVFCGGGGNTIQFAMQFPYVYGVDYSIEHIYCTAKNAQSYGVDDRIWLKQGSWKKLISKGKLSKIKYDCVFGSPPWGGPEYLRSEVYDLEQHLEPMGITKMLRSFLKLSPNVIMFLPRNSDLEQLSRATRKVLGLFAKCKVLYVKENGYMKGMLCMWGECFLNYEPEAQENKKIELCSEDEELPREQKDEPSATKGDKSIDIYDING
ncbi:tgs1p [Saccharomyces arboricola H-6]|uniref:Trimethylguanosine synthase n=1 Tax=Saccharomyces arboricola (strain H-6 / AS 2.3317 / CBS 10644) TaxID=1160507 RepID=J8PVK3_SACAR|nr:tgs1p [Saccharomyces arboricola H-6]